MYFSSCKNILTKFKINPFTRSGIFYLSFDRFMSKLRVSELYIVLSFIEEKLLYLKQTV